MVENKFDKMTYENLGPNGDLISSRYDEKTTPFFIFILGQELYKLGARKIGVTTLPPLGCVPAVITIFGKDSNDCVEKVNKAAISFNNKLNATSQSLQSKLSGLNLVVLDIYQPLYDLVTKPSDNGNLSIPSPKIKYIIYDEI